MLSLQQIITWIQLFDQHLSITQQYNKGHILYMFSKSNLSFCPFKSWPMNFLLALYRSQKPFIIHVERFYVTKIRFFWINWTAFCIVSTKKKSPRILKFTENIFPWCPLTITYVHLLKWYRIPRSLKSSTLHMH